MNFTEFHKISIKSIINLCSTHQDIDESFVLKMLGDEDMRAMFSIIQEMQANPKAIMNRTNIPQTTVYRKLYEMLSHGMIKGIVEHRRDNYEVIFFPMIEKIRVLCMKGNLNVKVTPLENQEHLVLDQ